MVCKSLRAQGAIATTWPPSICQDGDNATYGALWCYEQPQPLDTDLMRDIQRYNEVDCKVMWEILIYLRSQWPFLPE